MKKKIKMEYGELTIEAVIVVTTAIFIIFLTLDIALAVYRQVNVSIIANKVATSIGNIYGSKYKEPDMAYQNINDFKRPHIYRYFGKEEMNNENKEMAIWYAGYSLKKTELSSEEAEYNNEIQASINTNAIGNQIITITITRKYHDFFLTPVSWLGIEPVYTCSASGTAQCYDIISYVNEKNFRKEVYSEIGSSNPVTSIVDSFLSSLETVIDTIKLMIESE